MKKAIVTGATGFIGKFLVRELVKQNVEVIAVVRRGTKNLNTINALPVKIVECNIADYHMLPDMIADRDIDVVFHIAWQGVSDLDARNEAIQMQNLQSRKFTDYITKYGSSLAYLDQDVLNGVVEQEKKVKLPMRYNTLSIYFYATYEQVLKIRRSKSQDFYSKEEFSEAISNPGLVHFTTCFLDGLRPWIKGNQHPYLKTFLKYKEMSPWRDIPLQEDKRSGLVKFRTTMIRKAPRFVLCEVASVLHGVIIPEKNYKRMQERVKE